MAKCVPPVASVEHTLVVAGVEEAEEMGTACLQAYSLSLGLLPPMITRAACELGIPDILLAHQPLSALQIAQKLSYPCHPPPPQHKIAELLDRIMRFLCAHGVFKAHMDSTSADAVKYCLTPLSRWLLRRPAAMDAGEEVADTCTNDTAPGVKHSTATKRVGDMCHSGTGSSLRDFLLLQTFPIQPPWHQLCDFILKGGQAAHFFKEYDMHGWTLMNSNPQFGRVFNDAMSSDSHISMDVLLKEYHGFEGVHTLVDVGGGIGTTASYIVAKYPTIKAITFDLPQVIAAAPSYPGVELIGGDMFEQIPEGDAIFIKWIFHNWDDEKCIKILKNCRKVLPKNGKVVIMDAVLAKTFNHEQSFNNLRTSIDMLMLTVLGGGKERTIQQWEFLFKSAEFPQYKVIELPCIQSIIEAFPTFDKNRT